MRDRMPDRPAERAAEFADIGHLPGRWPLPVEVAEEALEDLKKLKVGDGATIGADAATTATICTR